MGSLGGIVDSGSDSDDSDGILDEILNCAQAKYLPYDGDVVDDSSSSDLKLEMEDPEINIWHDLPTMTDFEEVQSKSNPPMTLPRDGAMVDKTDLSRNLSPDLQSPDLSMRGMDFLCEAAAMDMESINRSESFQKPLLNRKKAIEKKAVHLKEPQRKLKGGFSTAGFEPRKKACYKRRGISLRLSRRRFGI